MNIPVEHRDAGLTCRHCWFLGVAWLLIAIKCAIVTWAIGHWSVPINAIWIVGPTILFAALATGLWVAHRE